MNNHRLEHHGRWRTCEFDERVQTTEDVYDASFVAIYPKRPPSRVVLRHYDPGAPQPYVVHVETFYFVYVEGKTLLLHRSFEDGIYFSDLGRAKVVFQERAAKL